MSSDSEADAQGAAAARPNAICAILRCEAPSSGLGPYCCLPLCHRHLRNEDTKKAEINELRKHRGTLEAIDRRIVSEMQDVEDGFEQVNQLIKKWQQVVTVELMERHERVQGSITDFASVDIFEQQLLEVQRECSRGTIFEILASLEKTVDLLKVDYVFSKGANGYETSANRMRAEAEFGDVSSSVKELQLVIEQRMTGMVAITNLNCGQSMRVKASASVCQPLREIAKLGGNVTHVAACDNTTGFAADENKRVVAMADGQLSENGERLPPEVIFVMLANVKFLVVVSTADESRYECHCDVNWDVGLVGIHCDSRRQQLFIQQPTSVSVAGLGGAVLRVVTAAELETPIENLSGIAGNGDKYFVFDCKTATLLGVDKETDKVELSVVGKSLTSGNATHGVALSDHKILVTDPSSRQLVQLCGVTERQLAAFPSDRDGCPAFANPAGVAVDSRGVMFVSDYGKHVVHVLLQDGTCAQTIGDANRAGSDNTHLNSPCGLAVIAGEGGERLVVADCANRRLMLYSLL